ncbi:MAG: peptidase T, partial [Clostridia bacterium]|nr:peptidase T [Clostridia bacterium]
MIDQKRLVDTFLGLVAVDAESGDEAAIREKVRKKLASLGISSRTDGAGNLFAAVPGELPGDPILFSSHLDTVRPGKGKRAVARPDGRITS